MASALDKLREHTAALQAVAKAAQEVERVLEGVQAELVPLVGDLREVRRETEKIRKQQDPEAAQLDSAHGDLHYRGGCFGELGGSGVLQVISATIGLTACGKGFDMVDLLLSWLRLAWNWIVGWDVSTYEGSRARRGPRSRPRVCLIPMIPNIFKYATKELSQDAVVCWLVACARAAPEELHIIGLAFVQALMRSGNGMVIDVTDRQSRSYEQAF